LECHSRDRPCRHPEAEKADARLALHLDDPPVAMMNGAAKLLVNYDGYRGANEEVG
jgi:D-mannonate dehydratase